MEISFAKANFSLYKNNLLFERLYRCQDKFVEGCNAYRLDFRCIEIPRNIFWLGILCVEMVASEVNGSPKMSITCFSVMPTLIEANFLSVYPCEYFVSEIHEVVAEKRIRKANIGKDTDIRRKDLFISK